MAGSCSDRRPHENVRAEPGLDQLFERLRGATDSDEAQRIEVAIIGVWSESGKDDVDRLMLQGLRAMRASNFDAAETIFDEVVRLAPTFTEGWSMRAVIHWLRDDYVPAVGDLRQVLVLEPRHFRALNLLGRIFVEVGQRPTAVKVLEYALAINPHLEDAQRQLRMLREEVAGLPI